MGNPYSCRLAVEPSMFFGREKEIISIINRISASSPLCTSITGFRRIGKSSLLRFIDGKKFYERLKEKSENEYLIILLDFQKLTDIDDLKFFRYLSKMLRSNLLQKVQNKITPTIERQLNDYVKTINNSDDMFDVKNEYFETIISIITIDLRLKLILLMELRLIKINLY